MICDGEVFEFAEGGLSEVQSLPEYHHNTVIAMTDDFLVFGQKNWAGLRTYYFDKEHKMYDSRSHINCRSQNSCLVN